MLRKQIIEEFRSHLIRHDKQLFKVAGVSKLKAGIVGDLTTIINNFIAENNHIEDLPGFFHALEIARADDAAIPSKVKSSVLHFLEPRLGDISQLILALQRDISKWIVARADAKLSVKIYKLHLARMKNNTDPDVDYDLQEDFDALLNNLLKCPLRTKPFITFVVQAYARRIEDFSGFQKHGSLSKFKEYIETIRHEAIEGDLAVSIDHAYVNTLIRIYNQAEELHRTYGYHVRNYKVPMIRPQDLLADATNSIRDVLLVATPNKR